MLPQLWGLSPCPGTVGISCWGQGRGLRFRPQAWCGGSWKGMPKPPLMVGWDGVGTEGCSQGDLICCSLLAGQDLCLGGFMGALQGALICASTILKRNLYADLARLKVRLQATRTKKGE